VDELIGAGGMGQVYRATDSRLKRTVALKLLLPELTRDPGFSARFEREARLLASLNHPNVAAIYGFEQVDDVLALVLEYVDGQTLEQVIAGPRPKTSGIEQTLLVARQIALALEAAHDKGIISSRPTSRSRRPGSSRSWTSGSHASPARRCRTRRRWR
jgi:serine/threonine-protein kinase